MNFTVRSCFAFKGCRTIAVCAALSILVIATPYKAFAADAQHESRVRAAETAYLKSGLIDNPWDESFLDAARVSNLGVPEATWVSINAEMLLIGEAIEHSPDSPYGQWIRPTFEALSDQELDRLTVLFSDPVFVKFIQIRHDPDVLSITNEPYPRNYERVLGVSNALHDALARHGLSCCKVVTQPSGGK
jgi:hypothetical protein